MSHTDLTGWTPIRVYRAGARLMVDWCRTGARRFTEPFFEDTLDRVFHSPAALLFRQQTSIEEAVRWSDQHPGLRPDGFLFHMSRCGSTLVSQMLAALPENRVLSEPAALDGVLRAHLISTEPVKEAGLEWLRAMVNLLGQPAGGEAHYFLKLDCWHTPALPLMMRAFPGTPWIFLYRDPAAVLASQMKMPGRWTLPGSLDPSVLGLDSETSHTVSRAEYCALALERILAAALAHFDDGPGLLVNYDQLPEAACDEIPRHFHLTYDKDQVIRMRKAAAFDAKMPSLPYLPGRRGITPENAEIQAMAERVLLPLYERLESLRRKPGRRY